MECSERLGSVRAPQGEREREGEGFDSFGFLFVRPRPDRESERASKAEPRLQRAVSPPPFATSRPCGTRVRLHLDGRPSLLEALSHSPAGSLGATGLQARSKASDFLQVWAGATLLAEEHFFLPSPSTPATSRQVGSCLRLPNSKRELQNLPNSSLEPSNRFGQQRRVPEQLGQRLWSLERTLDSNLDKKSERLDKPGVFSLVCGLALLLLPLTLHPLYIHGENAMVLEISPSSPLSDYLSRGDVILSVDGEKIHSPHELMEKMVQVDTKLLQGMGSNEKGYCVPNVLLEESKTVSVLDDNFSCPDGHAAFIGLPCLNSSSFFEISSKHHGRYKKENKHCLSPELVVKLTKCGEGWGGTGFLKNPCSCSKNEYCMKPLLIPGMSWFEVSYAKPYSSECFQLRRNTSLVDFNPGYGSYPCGIGTFVYVGDMLILAHSMRLSAYQPRWMHFSWSMDVPSTLENILACAYHVSAALAAINSLPVFFLDGEYILETALYYITWLNPRKRRRAAKVTLIAGTILSVIALSRIIYFTYYSVTKV